MHPGFLFCIPWITFLTLLVFSNYEYDGSSLCYIYLLFGTIVFQLGCFLGIKKIKRKERLINTDNQFYFVNFKSLKLIMIAEGLFVLFILFIYLIFMRSHFHINIFLTFHTSQFQLPYAGIIGYCRNMFSAFGICMVVGYPRIRLEEREKYKKYILIQLPMYFFMTITRITRNEMLFAALPLFIAFIIVTKQKNAQVFKKMFIAVILFLVVFSTVAIMKYYDIFINGNYISNLYNQIVLYGSGGIVAFQKQFDIMDFESYGGANTLRFFQAVFDKLAGTHYAMPLIQEFSPIGMGEVTNVYTFYQWYANDFGIIYALFVQFIIGIIHGVFYRKMSKMNVLGIYVYCLLVHPLVMQIFQDQYSALTSSWLQYLIAGFVFLKTDIIFGRSARKNGFHLYLEADR